MPGPVAVGLVGAGPWAQMVHAPMLAAGPETRLAGVWARRPEAAADLAAKHGVPSFDRYEQLLDNCEAVAFCVAPDAQVDLAIAAARAGKPLLLEKPLAGSLADAERLATAVAGAGVPSMLMLSYRYAPHVRRFIDEARGFEASGARGGFVGGGFLPGSPFAFGWRLERGALLDLGPHVFDLAEAVLGPIARLRASGDPLRFAAVLAEHESGAVSTLSFSGSVAVDPPRVGLELFGPRGTMALDALAADWPEVFATIRSEFAAMVRTRQPHELDAARGLHLQQLVAEAGRDHPTLPG